MQAITTIVARAKLRPAGYRRLDAIRGMLNRLYNAALEQRKLAWQQGQEAITRFDQFKLLTGLRQADPEGLGALALGAERRMLIRLDNAFQSFFRRCRSGEAPGFPRFRPLQRMECIDVVQVSGGMVRRRKKGYVLRIKGFPHMRLHPSRGLPEGRALRAVRIVRKPQGVRVSLCYAVKKQALEPSAETVGIDMGVRSRMTLSDGTAWPAARPDWQAIRRQQRVISR